MANWGPLFYKPGSGGTPQSGVNGDTNTGTLNFPASPNNGTDFMFIHDFATNAAMVSFYPIAPTNAGAYGIKFLGSAPPSPALFTDGLVFATGPTYPSVTPQITSVNNGAVWASNKLHINPTGTTTLTLSTFSEYASTTYGSLIGAGIYNDDGVIAPASVESGYLPMGDSSESPDPIYQPPVTQLTVNGSWLIPGQNYTLELQYSVIAGRPEEANVNGIEWQGVTTYRKLTTISLVVSPDPARIDFNGDGQSDILWQNTATGERIVWLMDGTTFAGGASLGSVPVEWSIRGSGDFNADGKSDILWQNTTTGDCYIWLMNGLNDGSSVYLATLPVEWKIAGSGDFNSDGKSDIIWQNTVTGERSVWLMNGPNDGSPAYLTTVPVEWDIANK